MKKLLLHIILFSYAIVMFKPLFPYVKDAVNHLVYYKQHMATEHVENGKYHVHVEVTKNAKEENSNKSIPTSKKENTSTDHIVFIAKTNDRISILISQKYIGLAGINLSAGNLDSNYPPPRI
ncbi:MAG: hypothetical protein LH615_03195 [Ferruginibacter sp.]|nr:hypothetical protein [Ferruginibacter sp.]